MDKNDYNPIGDKNNRKKDILTPNNHLNNIQTTKVDSILENIIPNYNKQISIKLEHVDLTFEVKNEKLIL